MLIGDLEGGKGYNNFLILCEIQVVSLCVLLVLLALRFDLLLKNKTHFFHPH